MTIADVVRTIHSGVTLTCPRCRAAPLFRGWFAMHDRCEHCDFVFERAQGYFVGAIYLNYMVTIGICLVGFLALERWSDLSSTGQVVLWTSFSVLFPLAFFRYSRSLWLSLEYLVNPDAG